MLNPSHDVKGGTGLDDSKFFDRPSQRRRWDAFGDPKSHLEYTPLRRSRWDASTQVPSERQRPTTCPTTCPTTSLEGKSSSMPRPLSCDVSTQVPSLRPSHNEDDHSSPLGPASRIAGGNGCTCCPCPPIPCERPVESCLPGLHQKYVDAYDTKGHAPEGHLPAGYRKFVEHDDLYLPPMRVLSPATTDHDDLYLPLKTNDCSPRDCCPQRMCDPDPTYGDIYLPLSRPCTPAFPKDPCPPPCCPPPPCGPCPPPPCPPSRDPHIIVCSCPPYIKKLSACPPSPPANDCSSSAYINKFSGCSPPPSRPPSPPPSCRSCCPPVQKQCSSVYIDEVPSPPPGTRYVACQECLCHKDISTRSLCVPRKINLCRDCVCHLGSRSPSQGVTGSPKGYHMRCLAGFQSPGKPRFKLNQNAQCLECKSPNSCKGPPNCNPQYIVETPLSRNSRRSRSPTPRLRSRSPMGADKGSSGSPRSSGCCDTPKGGSSSSNKCGGPPKVSPKLFEDPCCSPCRPLPSCRPLLAAEMLSGMEACASQAKACGRSPASCMDPRCNSCDCHKPKCPPPPCRSATPPPPCSPCSKPSPPPCRPSPPPCRPLCFDDDVHNPSFKTFQSTSPRCKDCDCHKPKNCKLSSQICKFCRGSGWCYCEYHTTLQLMTDSEGQPSPHQDKLEVEKTKGSQVSGLTPDNLYRSSELSARSAKVEFNESLRDEDTVKDVRPKSDITQICCCGACEYTKPRFPMKTECPFCKQTHSCCCGMCSCPVPTCSSKAPLNVSTPACGVSVNNSDASTGRGSTFPYSHRPRSLSQITPRKKLGFASPDKSPPAKLFPTASSHLLNTGMCYSSPKTRATIKTSTRR